VATKGLVMTSIGGYLGKRLIDLGVKDYFVIPGDYNLSLLDELLKVRKLNMINCCNELNAAYAADGYARVHGIAALFVTFCVGSLSAINGIAGAYAENLPLLLISGGPNTHSIQQAEVLHHTLGNEDHLFVKEIYEKVSAHTVRIQKPEQAAAQIDNAIAIALQKQKPVYIEIACNIAAVSISEPTKRSFQVRKYRDKDSLKAAIFAASEMLNNATKPVLIAGSKMRPCQAFKAVDELSRQTGYALAAMADAKGFISETHPNFIGIYWGPVSSPGCAEIIDSSDAYLLVGPNQNDYLTVGHMWGIVKQKSVCIADGVVTVGTEVFTNIYMNEFLTGLQKKLKTNDRAFKAYQRIEGQAPAYHPPQNKNQVINTRYLFGQIQTLLTDKTALIAETGDSWFNCMRLRLPEGCQFEIQMQYGSIGWSVGALLGMQAALKDKKRVIACIGDGSFQMSAQELSTLIRYQLKPIIFLMNNASYTIEVQIHDGPYNEINNWQYHQLVQAFSGKMAKSFVVKTNQELLQAIDSAKKTDALCFIEVILDKDDCNKQLLEWGSRVARYNGRL
jgi:indolepyruvate decarboxylase